MEQKGGEMCCQSLEVIYTLGHMSTSENSVGLGKQL